MYLILRALLLLMISFSSIADHDLLPPLVESFGLLNSTSQLSCQDIPGPSKSLLPMGEELTLCDAQGRLAQTGIQTIVNTLSAVTKQSIETTSPFAGSTSGYPFDGNYDWHSSIHGHWMLLSMARATNDQSLQAYVTNRISEETLVSITNEIQRGELHSGAYGLSWLSLLVRELELTQQYNPEVLSSLKRVIVSGLNSEAETLSSEVGDYDNLNFTVFAARQSSMDETLIPNIIQRSNVSAANRFQAPSVSDFFDANSMNNIIHGSASTQIIDISLPEDISLYNCHALGRYFSTGWIALSSISNPEQRSQTCSEMESRINNVLMSSSLFGQSEREQFVYINHWVPQFMWMFVHLNSK